MKKGGKLEGDALSVSKGWKVAKLGDVIQLEYGKPLPASKRREDGKYPVYGANGEIARSNEYYYDKPTMIVGRKGSAGEINLTEKKFWALDVTYFVTFDDEKYDLRFLYYLLSKLELTKLAKGVKPGINRNEVYSIEVVIPPLPEQQRIVALLDEAFAALTKVHLNAEQNLVNARELFEAVLESFFEDPQHTPDGKVLESLCELIVDCEHKTAPIQDEGYPSIRTPNIGRGFFILEGVNRVSEETYKRWTRRAIPEAGDLILAREAPAGNVAVIPEGLEPCLGQRTVLIRPNKRVFDPYYLMWLLLSDNVQKFFVHNSKGSTVVHVNMKDIRGLKINNIPSLTEQRAIVGKLDALSAETKRLEEIYQSKLEAVEELRKSVLQKAFAGEL